jgi:transketolase
VLGGVPRIGIEAGSGFGWDRWLGTGGVFVGPDECTAGGLTPAAVVALVRRRLAAGA